MTSLSTENEALSKRLFHEPGLDAGVCSLVYIWRPESRPASDGVVRALSQIRRACYADAIESVER